MYVYLTKKNLLDDRTSLIENMNKVRQSNAARSKVFDRDQLERERQRNYSLSGIKGIYPLIKKILFQKSIVKFKAKEIIYRIILINLFTLSNMLNI
jgi:hypothetical protein